MLGNLRGHLFQRFSVFRSQPAKHVKGFSSRVPLCPGTTRLKPTLIVTLNLFPERELLEWCLLIRLGQVVQQELNGTMGEAEHIKRMN